MTPVTPAAFRKRPIEITAVRYGKDEDGTFYEGAVDRVARFMLGLPPGETVSAEQMASVLIPASGVPWDPSEGHADLSMYVRTAHDDWLPLALGDYVIRDVVGGQFRTCKPWIFEETYEETVLQPQDAPGETKDARSRDVVHVFKATNGEWHWQRKAANHQIISIGGEGYTERNDAIEIATAINPGVAIDADPWK